MWSLCLKMYKSRERKYHGVHGQMVWCSSDLNIFARICHESWRCIKTPFFNLYVMLLSMLMILLFPLNVIGRLFFDNILASELKPDIRETELGSLWSFYLNFWRTQLVSFDCLNIFVAIDVKIDAFALDEKLSLRCWGCLFVVMSIGAIALCLIRKLENWSINLCEVPCSEVVLYPCISTNQPCMECCFHVWTGDLNCYLDMLGKLQE